MTDLEVMENELKCVQRDCCRQENECAKCDLVLPQEVIENVYKSIIKKLKKSSIPKWHSVADGDLPKEGTEVLNDDGVKVILVNGHWRYVYGSEWEDDACVDHWCEIPRFEGE